MIVKNTLTAEHIEEIRKLVHRNNHETDSKRTEISNYGTFLLEHIYLVKKEDASVLIQFN